uniref:Annexin n=1 Tax=Electrophorus electricus TaxID=8005 RepID=A0A4W4FS74_ELEEL
VTLQYMGTRGTVKEATDFNPEADAQKLKAAMKGIGTDESAIIAIIAHRSIAQRQQIKMVYKRDFGKDLDEDLKSELSGQFEKVVTGLLKTAPVYDAYELRNAIKGAGTDEACLLEILASRSNAEIKALTAAYSQEYGKVLEEDICGDTSGMFKRVLVSLLTAGRDECTTVDEALAKKDAKEMYDAGEARWGTDEDKFLTILCIRNRSHLLRGIHGNTGSCVVKVQCVKSKPAFFAERLHKSMKGLGTTDSILIRVMVSRCEIDMLDIKTEFLKMYGKTLHSFIKGDTSGHYGKILLELCGPEK